MRDRLSYPHGPAMNEALWDFKKDVVVVVDRVEMWTIEPPTSIGGDCGQIPGSFTRLSTAIPRFEVGTRLKTPKLGVFSTFPQLSTAKRRKNRHGCEHQSTVWRTRGRLWTAA